MSVCYTRKSCFPSPKFMPLYPIITIFCKKLHTGTSLKIVSRIKKYIMVLDTSSEHETNLLPILVSPRPRFFTDKNEKTANDPNISKIRMISR